MAKTTPRFLSKYAKVSFAQQGEDLVLRRILFRMLKVPLDYKGFYLDIGAYHPEKDSITRFLYDEEWRGICVDISENTINLFREERPRDRLVCAAAGESKGELTAYFLPGVISVQNTCDVATAEKMRSKGYELSERRVPVLTANEIMQLNAPEEDGIDFLNIDVEGFEISVLRGLDFDKYKPRVVALEIHSGSVDCALKTEVAEYLANKGYKCVACCVITYFFVRR